MNALAEVPAAVEGMVSRAGAHEFVVRLFDAGVAVDVNVDDLVPSYAADGGGALFTACVDRDACWAQLVEKACAKLFGSFAALRRGWAYEGLQTLTGAPCEAIRFGDARVARDLESGDLWTRIRFWLETGSVVCASTPDDDDAGDGAAAAADRVFAVLEASDVRSASGDRRQTLLLRDASGRGDLPGAPGAATADETRPDAFWLDWRDAAAAFALVSACHVAPSAGGAWASAACAAELTRDAPAAYFAGVDVDVTLHPKDERFRERF